MDKILAEINKLKQQRNALILAHNYVNGPVQDLADFVGDSLELSLRAKKAQAPVIVFAGVRFMGETAKILAPASCVLLPVPEAGCPMADMAEPQAIRQWRKAHPDALIVAYVNTTAATKAEVDICCTSANAEKVIASLPADREILLLPDRNLAANIAAKLGRKITLWPGCCPIHDQVTPEMAASLKQSHPGSDLLVHLECRPEVNKLAAAGLSTGGMLRYVENSGKKEFLIGTEEGILHRLHKEHPDKQFYSLEPRPVCRDMKLITPEKILETLRNMSGEVILDEELMNRARLPIEKMLAL